MVEEISIIKSDECGTIYDCGKVNLIVRKKGSVSADHSHEDLERLYLIEGKIELTIDKNIEEVIAPAKIEIPSNAYHKILALTDVKLIEDK